MFYFWERNIYNGLFPFIYKLEYFLICSNISFKTLESNPQYHKKKPYEKIPFDIFL